MFGVLCCLCVLMDIQITYSDNDRINNSCSVPYITVIYVTMLVSVSCLRVFCVVRVECAETFGGSNAQTEL